MKNEHCASRKIESYNDSYIFSLAGFRASVSFLGCESAQFDLFLLPASHSIFDFLLGRREFFFRGQPTKGRVSQASRDSLPNIFSRNTA